MTVTISAALVSTTDPRPVRILLNGITTGLAYTVTATAAGSSWVPSGGTGVSTGGQVIVDDTRTPLNTPITYSVVVAGATYTASPVTVVYAAGRGLLQSLDGTTVVRCRFGDNTDQRDLDIRSVAFPVPGRRRPPVRYASGGDGGGTLTVFTVGAQTSALHELLITGRPIIVRTDGLLPNMAAVDIIKPQAAGHHMQGASTKWGDTRQWTIPYLLADDPQPSKAPSAFSWDSFDLAMANRSWSNPVVNPTFDANTTGWAGAGSATLAWQSSGGSTTPGFARLTATSTTAISANASATFAVTAGDLFAAQAMFRGTVGRFAHLRLTWTGASATQATAVALTSATVWQQYTYTGTVPAGATAVRVDLLMDATIAAGNVLDVDAVQYTPLTNTVRPYPQDFDAIFAGLTWDQFDTMDWSQLA